GSGTPTVMRFILILLTTLLASQTPAPARGDEWRQFRGNPSLTGIAATTLPQTPKLLWKYETGDHIESSAAIADGVVYVGVGNGDLIAVELTTGKLRWKYSADTFFGESSPAVGPDAVYIGDLDGMLHAVSIRDGKRLWTYKTEAEIKSSPILVND